MARVDFLFHIVSTSGVPIYRQLMDQINAMVASGRLKPGTFLPSIREVGKELEINPMTVSKAYSLLERDGILENVRGQGMSVVETTNIKKNMKVRRETIEPFLKQVIRSANQLQLNKKNVFEMIDELWKE